MISTEYIISASAIINHASMCCDGVDLDCNDTVEGYCLVPVGTKICRGEVYKRKDTARAEDVF